MNFYRVHGLLVESAHPFDWCPAPRTPEKSLKLSFERAPRLELSSLHDEFEYEGDDEHCFLNIGGIEMRLDDDTLRVMASPELAASRIERAAIPFIRHLRADPGAQSEAFFHASATAWQGRACIFLGESGAGKSSTAWALHRKCHWDLVADDHLILDAHGRAVPCGTPARLRRTLEDAPAQGRDPTTQKFHVVPDRWVSEPVGVDAFVLLTRGKGGGLSPCDPKRALSLLSAALILFESEPSYRVRIFRSLTRVLEEVAVLEYEFPASDSGLPDHAEGLHEELIETLEKS